MKSRRLPHLLSALLLAATIRQSVAADVYRTYRNARFGYAVVYPATLMTPGRESDNGDGRHFRSRDGSVSLLVWGSGNGSHLSADAALRLVMRHWTRQNARITLAKGGIDRFVLSGFLGDKIFYQKTVLWNGAFHSLLWQYPTSLRRRLDAPVTRSALAFTPSFFARPRVQSVASRPPAPKAAPTPALVARATPRPSLTPLPAHGGY